MVSKSRASCFADVNECATGKHNCNGSFICHNTKGSFLCICREPGYFWNGVNCTGKYLLHIEIVDSSDKKRPQWDQGLSYDEIIVIIVIIGIADIFPFSLKAILKKKMKRERFVQFLRFQFYKNNKFRHDL